MFQEFINMSLESIKYKRGKLEILDQLLLPLQTRYVKVQGVEDGWKVINKMQVKCSYSNYKIFYVGLSVTISVLHCQIFLKKLKRCRL